MAKGSCGLLMICKNPFFISGGGMKAIVVERIGDFEIRDVPMRYPKPDEVLLHVSVTGLCRTDLKLIRVGHRDLVLPRIPGEEVVGVVVETGHGAEAFQQGQRAFVYPGQSCGICSPCRAGAENLCTSMEIMGFHRDGGFAEYVVAPTKSLIPIPPGLSDEEAVFAEPLSCCLNALELSRITEEETIGIWGAGPAGILLARAAVAKGAIPFNIDPDERRSAFAEGATSPPAALFDVCVVAVGSNDAYEQALLHLKPRGRLVVFSGLSHSRPAVMTDFNQLHYMEQTLVGAYGCSFRHGEQALACIASGAITVRDLISHRMDFDRFETALEIVEHRAGMKVHLYPR
jgi:L-iditol 2-dehydrogenase